MAVFILVAIRQIGNLRFQIWQIMLFGALAVLFTGQISPIDALISIDPDVMLFLFGMFVIGGALEESGYLSHLSYRIFSKAKSVDSLILLILFGVGFLSALLMNDTLAIIGTPVVLLLARQHHLSPKLMLLTLAFAVTIGSVTSPIGNPQNLLIAVRGEIPGPFLTFSKYLLLPTLLNLFLAYLLLKSFYRKEFHSFPLSHSSGRIRNWRLARTSKTSLFLVITMVAAKVFLVSFIPSLDFRLTYIALVPALFILIVGPKRRRVLRAVDWHTLVFFASMFVLMKSVWNTGFFQNKIAETNLNLLSLPAILTISVLLSQFLSNVPLVALYLPMLKHAGASSKELVALAAGSTIAGNLSILGAASNVIIIQNAEKRGETLTFWEFVRIGVPLTLINLLIYWIFLSIL
ncbi:MAG: anion transporter [Candidatus Hadarchaeales archaeon]